MSWELSHTAETAASPREIWSRYADVAGWCEWSKRGVVSSEIHGPFTVGTTGRMKSPRSPTMSFELVAVEPDRSFVSQIRLPFARLRFEHVLDRSASGTRITHRVTLSGPLSSLYSPFVKRSIERGLADGVDRLGRLAQTSD